MKYKQIILIIVGVLLFLGCSDNVGNDELSSIGGDTSNPKYSISYKGLSFYKKDKAMSSYQLPSLSDAEFNALTPTQQRIVADKLLSTLFFGMDYAELTQKIQSETFLSDIAKGLKSYRVDKAAVEEEIVDDEKYRQDANSGRESRNILARFYAMDELDAYFYHNWIAYILTQTIMFSPAYELDSSHVPNIARVYNNLVLALEEEEGMRYISYAHMMSEDNWRRFRSPEDNGREMLEIFTLDTDDTHVPTAAKALQNWKLDRDNDTLVVSLNENTTALKLFNTTIVNGDDFYRELAKSSLFTKGVVTRLVDFFFHSSSASKKRQIISAIVASKPEKFQDILTQIIFSKEYLLHTSQVKSGEELFFSLTKKMHFRHNRNTFLYLNRNLEAMHQASMKYKLGKIRRVPLDTLSFANYHKYVRENILLKHSNEEKIDEYDSYAREGWSRDFVAYSNFNYDISDEMASLDSLVQYLFHTIIARDATQEELALFREHMSVPTNRTIFTYTFDMFTTYDEYEKQESERVRREANIVRIVLDYLSRVDSVYMQSEVK